ncbi:YhcN/YlaJ family sporulation lipoprotein [Evansella tamaricis]|uniref:YhcN/YlaJ family sporulation lipoprotein n=1 Tax=Evansella tamaricis TaxID=2069301 RepID=A0ABS6JH49_9BACI|nr:YhcN/YlaJ family sporulation lipoprotein [Evansella tamaricis]MBU9712999.1 YhcN/YlaJ family sporulation lipoprotein [Evansella tamaricis]
MKKTVLSLITLLSLSLITSGCGNTEGSHGAEGQQMDLLRGYQQPNQHFVLNRRATDDTDQYTRFGFGRYTDTTALGGAATLAVYDRSLMAETIGQLTASLKDVRESAALVTDQHVLVAYDSGENEMEDMDRKYLATQVRNTAYSIVPAYFDVYVSDDPVMMLEIEKYRGMSSKDQDYVGSLNATIDLMLESPQGEQIDFENSRMEDWNNDQFHEDINDNRAGAIRSGR